MHNINRGNSMVNLLIKVVKRIIVAFFMLYGLNLIISSLNIVIPINIITIFLVGLLGIPGLCTLVALFFVL
ncbi:MAG: hypothetical protein E7164_02315 [Firmicutes bacterium]|nr:hypothetical protein [Bacillota bacterium]